MSIMKILWSWFADPCVHLIVIGLLLMRLLMGITSEAEPESLSEYVTKCSVCGTEHENGVTCPVLAVQRDALPAAN